MKVTRIGAAGFKPWNPTADVAIVSDVWALRVSEPFRVLDPTGRALDVGGSGHR
jgi:hypothetical protein